MSDQQQLFCLNPDCGEVIQKNKKDAYPKRCVECDQPVPEVKKPERFECPHCHEVLNKNKRGLYPKTCPECDKPTNPFQALKIDIVRCSNSVCGEEIKKNRRGKYPRYCGECDEPVVLPNIVVLECPSCHEERPRSTKTGRLARICPQCGHNYEMGASMSQSMMSSLPSQTYSLVNVYSSPDHSLSPGSSTRPMTPTSPHRGDNLSETHASPGEQPQLPSDSRSILPAVHHAADPDVPPTVVDPVVDIGSDATQSPLSQLQEVDQQKTESRASMSQSMMSSIPSQTYSLVNVYSSPDHSLSPGSSTRPMAPTSPHRGDNLSETHASPGEQPQLPSDSRSILPAVYHTADPDIPPGVIELGSDATHSTLSQLQEADQQKTKNDPPSSTTHNGDGPHSVHESHGPHSVHESHGPHSVKESHGPQSVHESHGPHSVHESHGSHSVNESHDMSESWCIVERDCVSKEFSAGEVQYASKRSISASDIEPLAAKSQKMLSDDNQISPPSSPLHLAQPSSDQSPPNQSLSESLPDEPTLNLPPPETPLSNQPLQNHSSSSQPPQNHRPLLPEENVLGLRQQIQSQTSTDPPLTKAVRVLYQPRADPAVAMSATAYQPRMSSTDPHLATSLRGPGEEGQGEYYSSSDATATDSSLANRVQDDPNYPHPSKGADSDLSSTIDKGDGSKSQCGQSFSNRNDNSHPHNSGLFTWSQKHHSHSHIKLDDRLSKTYPPRSMDQPLDSWDLSLELLSLNSHSSGDPFSSSLQASGMDNKGTSNQGCLPGLYKPHLCEENDDQHEHRSEKNGEGDIGTANPQMEPGYQGAGDSHRNCDFQGEDATEGGPQIHRSRGEHEPVAHELSSSTSDARTFPTDSTSGSSHRTVNETGNVQPATVDSDGCPIDVQPPQQPEPPTQQNYITEQSLTLSLPPDGNYKQWLRDTQQDPSQSLPNPKHPQKQPVPGIAMRVVDGQGDGRHKAVTANSTSNKIEIDSQQGGPLDRRRMSINGEDEWGDGEKQNDKSEPQFPGFVCTGPQQAQEQSAFGPGSKPEGLLNQLVEKGLVEAGGPADQQLLQQLATQGEGLPATRDSDNYSSEDEFGSSVDPKPLRRRVKLEEDHDPPSKNTRSQSASAAAANEAWTNTRLPGNTRAEIDVVTAFKDMKSKIDQAKKSLQDSKVLKKLLENEEEEYIHILVRQANAKFATYEGNLNSQKNRGSSITTKAVVESENGLRKFFNTHARKLSPILKKLHLPELLTLELATGRSVNRAAQSQVHNKNTVKVTFKMVLANSICKQFEQLKIEPVVEMLTNLDAFTEPKLIMKRGPNGIWMGTWNAENMTNKILQYKYYIHDGHHFSDEGYEWLGETSLTKSLVNRYLYFPSGEKEMTVYDGVVQLKSDTTYFKKFKVLVGISNSTKSQEQERGVREMLPHWCDEIRKGMSIRSLNTWILQVLNRQVECLSRFVNFTKDTDYQRLKDAKQLVEKVFTEYILQTYNDHLQLASSSNTSSAFASLAGLLHIAKQSFHDRSPHTKYAHHIPQLIAATLANNFAIPALNDREDLITSVLATLQGDGKFVKDIAISLTESFEFAKKDHTWILLIPLFHMLDDANMGILVQRGDDCDKQQWWGVAGINSHVKDLHRSYPNIDAWKQWLFWLSPYFSVDPILPYTFLALLTDYQLTNLIESENDVAMYHLPLDGILACARFHAISASHKVEKIVDSLLDLLKKLKAQQPRNLLRVEPVCLQLVKEFLELTLPVYSTIVKEEFFGAVQVYLFIMEYILANDVKSSVSELGAHLVFYSDRMVSTLTSIPGSSFISTHEIQRWNFLFGCGTDHTQISEWWSNQCKKTFKQRLVRLENAYPMAVVNLYCAQTFNVPAMDETVAESAFPKAEHILKESRTATWEAMPDKIGKLVDQALKKAWDTKDESPQNIVKNMVKWGNFLSVWKFYKGLSDTQKNNILPDTHARLLRSATAMDAVLNDLVSGNITFDNFTPLYENRSKVLELCEVSDSFRDQVELINATFEKREAERNVFAEFHVILSDFFGLFGSHIKDKQHLQVWLQRPASRLTFSDNVTSEPVTVKCAHIPDQLAQILQPFQQMKRRTIFFTIFQQHIREVSQGSLEDIAEVYWSSIDKYESIRSALAEGSVNIDKLERISKRYFSGSLQSLTDELKNMVSMNIYKERKHQIELCSHLDQYHTGARVMLNMQEMFGLKGDFSAMKRILESASKDLELKEISDELVKSADSVKDISPQQISCLEAFTQCTDFVEWIRLNVPKKDISNFVDLASSTGEDDLAAHKTRYLLNALTGYSPLLYDFDDEETDYNVFIEKCQKVWETMTQNEELEKNLRESAAELEWVKKVKTHFGNVEMKSMAQATAINESGVYHVGNIPNHSKDFQSLEDVMLLKCAVEDKGERKEKKYKYSDLKELQSKLTLVAGEQQKENRDTILKFDAMRDAVENLAKAYIDIRREGCIQFDDMLVVVHCKPSKTVGIEVKLQSINKVMVGRNNEKKDGALEHCQDLYKYMSNCVRKWRGSMDEYRSELTELNFYTTEQLVVLRKELGTFLDSGNPKCLDQALPLLAMIDTVDPVLLLQYITKFSKISALKETKDEAQRDTSKTFLSYNQMSTSQQNLVDDLLEEHESFTKLLAVQAVNDLGEEAAFSSFIEWIEKHFRDLEVAAETAEQSGSNSLQTSADLMRKLMEEEPKDSGLLGKLNLLWTGFIEMTSQSIKDFLSIRHLGFVLGKIYQSKRQSRVQRNLPSWLSRGKPCLIAIPQSQTYQMVLTIYEWDSTYPSPTRNEVLICNTKTRCEEVSLFLNRALNDPLSFYCMVNCHLLDYEVCRVIENRLSNTADDTVKDYGLAFIYAEEKRDARIRAYLDKHLVKNPALADLLHLAEYVQQILFVSKDVIRTACYVDESRSFARLIRSSRAGVGKSLHKNDLVESLRKDKRLRGVDITIPIYKTVNTDHIIDILTSELGNGYTDTPHNTIHIDIAHEVESGADELLFNLIILRSIVNSEGVVWQAQNTQYYIIECMPCTRKDGSSAHEVMNLLPTRTCRTPEEVCQLYSAGDSLPNDFIGFNQAILMAEEWQTVLKYLDCHVRNDSNYEASDKPFTSPLNALQLLIGNCGLKDPTWSELRHYVFFLSSQLFKVEKSPYCLSDMAEDLPGFRTFVIQFMFRMAKDFATRSLKIAEETPGLDLNQTGITGDENILNQLGMKRTWESGNHPYLFFNEDGATFTPLGFFVQSVHGAGENLSLIDSQTQAVLEPRCIGRDLKRALDQYQLSMSEDFDRLSRGAQLDKLRNVMVKTVKLSSTFTEDDGTVVYHPEEMFQNHDDPDPNYVLTMDNAKKILAIHQRLRVDIPVIIMGETGCGKTKLIDFMSKLQVPTALKDQINTMIIVKIHGGTTEEDIIQKVNDAQALAVTNQQICRDYAAEFDSEQVPTVYTILFLDEANTTEAIGLVKEILCDGRMRGKPLDTDSGLKIIAACNPYRKHSEAMIEKLKKAGLGYSVDESETKDKFGQIPMRHLVYRVQALSQSLLPLVWDFGTLRSSVSQKTAGLPPGDIESAYIRQMIVKFNQSSQDIAYGLNFGHHTAAMADILASTQRFMRDQKDECSFVSLRDIQRLLDVAGWFYSQRDHLFPAIDHLANMMDDDEFSLDGQEISLESGDEPAEYQANEMDYTNDYTIRSLVLGLGVCYLARLEDSTRLAYADFINEKIEGLIGGGEEINSYRMSGSEFLFHQIELCQDMFINEVVNTELHKNIAKNKALKENVFMMIVCIENRIPLFLVGKPGSSKSLSKSMVVDAMKGKRSESNVFKMMKQSYMVSFQCSRHATPAGIVGVFNHCANFQKEQDLSAFVSVVVLDEVGLAEDSENMPLKTLHPLLEDGCGDSSTKPEPYMKCAFVGISNWALDPAKMNRGIFVQRGTPHPNELEQIAKEICRSSESGDNDVGRFIQPLASGYLDICAKKKPDERDLTEFFGLRDFYSLMKMVVNLAQSTGSLNRNQLEHSIRRNFGGFDPDVFDPMDVFRDHCNMESIQPQEDGRPPIDSIGLIQSSLSGEDTALQGMESRYLLILTENLSVLSIILAEFDSKGLHPEVVFGSKFRDDVSYTQVCHNIYRIKTCMDMGKPVILLNLDDLYESLYDALNQYFSTWGDRKFVDLGLGTHRVKTFVDEKFRLVVIADKNKVHSQFPIPLINRLEKHYVSATSLLTEEQKQVKKALEEWAKEFVTPQRMYTNVCPALCEACRADLTKPYRLPCAHYIGFCCKERIANDELDRKCPVEDCGEVIQFEEWVIDTAALENRQYFENSTRETAFIGYSTETTALAVRKSSEEGCGNLTINGLLEHSKFHLLQCATGESVLRLNKTELAHEAKKIQNMYMEEQHHETLLQYLQYELPKAGCSSLFIQVTSFAELMNFADIRSLHDSLLQSGLSLEIVNIFLKDFVKEDQFTETVRSHYENTEHKCRLMLIQCESATENTELLDSVRFIIQRESEAALRLLGEEAPQTHTVLLLNLPRGDTFTGFQGGKWKCVHIDDPKSPQIRLPSLSKCLKLKPSDIIEKVMKKFLPEPDPSAAYEHDDDDDDGIMVIKKEHLIDDLSEDGADEIANNSSSLEAEEMVFDQMMPFILQCLPAAVSGIKSDHDYDRVALLKKLLTKYEDFTGIFLWHVHALLKKQEEFNFTHWVMADAAKASNMKQSETMRHSLEDALERAFVPALAAVISFIDVRLNLRILDQQSDLRSLWLRIFTDCHKLGLKFSTITKKNKADANRAKLPQQYKIQEVASGLQIFGTRLPFSWMIKDTIDCLVDASSNLRFGDSVESVIEQFKLSPIGRIIHIDQYMKRHTEILDLYITDFVYMAHPCTNKTEHRIVGLCLMKYLQRSIKQDLNLVHVNLAYKQQKVMFDNLTAIFGLVDNKSQLFEVVGKQIELDTKNKRESMPCDLLALKHLVKSIWEIKANELLLNPEGWVDEVEKCKQVVTQVLSSREDQEEEFTAECRISWLRLNVKKLYVEHIIVPSPVVKKTGKRAPHKLTFFTRDVNGDSFQSYETFQQVIKFLREAVAERIRSLYSNCPKACPLCKKPLDSPIKLPCQHFLCETCVAEEQSFCSMDNCGKDIPMSYHYDPAKDHIDEEQLNLLKDLRKRMNKFFMTFVSDIVFHGDEDPDEGIIRWLVDCVTGRDGETTRQFNLFNSAEVVDPTPVIRSFLLKLLLTCVQDQFVNDYLDQTLEVTAVSQQLQTMVLLMDCQKDIFDHQFIQDPEMLVEVLRDYTDFVTSTISQPHVETLTDLAHIQCYVSQSLEYLLTHSSTESHKRLEMALKTFLQRSTYSGNTQPGYLIARQLLVTHGESYIKDLVNTSWNFLVPDDVKDALESFTVPDVLSAYGGKRYKQAKSALDKMITETYPGDEFTNALNQFKQTCQNDESLMLMVIFTRITRTAVQRTPVAQQTRNGLMTVLEQGMARSHSKTLLEMLLQDGRLPREMDVNQSSGINLSMLVLNLHSCLCSGGVMADLYPLSEIINQPDQAAIHFLPTMADNQLELMQEVIRQALQQGTGENPTTYKCPNGHPYIIGDCGRPYYLANCNVCGAQIGGQLHTGAVGNQVIKADDREAKTQPGHILGAATNNSQTVRERELDPLSCSVLRCLTHLCMYTATLFNIQQVYRMIYPKLLRVEDVRPFLEAHIQLNLQQISQCCAESTDDCILLIHDVINRMKQASRQGNYSVLDSISKRRTWEQRFDTQYIKPSFKQRTQKITNIKEKLKSADSVDIKRLLTTSDKPINEENIVASAGLWSYRRPLTLAAVQNMLGSTVKNCPRLKDIADNCHVLMAVKYLPDVLTLIKSLNNKFHSRFSRAETSKMLIGDFCRRHVGEILTVRQLVQSFIDAWNTIFKMLGEVGGKPLTELHMGSPLSQFLIDQQCHTESTPFMLVAVLTDIHNLRLAFTDEPRPKVPLSAVTPTNIIGVENSDEILSLIASHSEYELRETTAITYNWPAIEREVLHRYISNKPRIEFSRDQLPCYVYQEDFNLHNQMQAISDSQEILSPDLQASIIKMLSIQVQTLTQHLKELKVVINFMSVMKHIERDQPLLEYMEATFGKEPNYLSKDIKLKHVIHVWLVVKYTQTDLLMRKHQEPFDDIDAECRENLSQELKTKLNTQCQFNSPRTKQLLQELFKYITLRLNKAAVQQDPVNPDHSLQDALTEFITYRTNEDDEERVFELLASLPNIPEDVQVKHVSKAWSYIWTRFTTKVE